MKCNHCSQWIHWRCTDLGDNGRWSSQFRGFCCRVVTPRSQNESRLGRRRKHRTEKRLRRLKLRDEKWVQAAKTQGKRETTTMWTWNIQRARVTFPRRDRFADILRVISMSRAEIVFLSELNEQAAAMQWVKSRELYGVPIHGKKSGTFLRDIWAVNWRDQGGKREIIGTRSTAVKVDGMKLVSTYQPIWGGDLQEFQSYREELSAMCRTNRNSDLMIIGGDFNSSIGAANNTTRDETTGPFGIGKMNAAGRNLKEWCQENEFCWLNSFFQQHRRGTWRNPATNQWHEIDGFIARSKDRKSVVSVWTAAVERVSDHMPKYIRIKERPRKKRNPPPKKTRRSTGTP